MKKKTRAIVVAVIIIATLGFVAYGMSTLFVDPYLSVDTVVQNPSAYMGREIQVMGKYVPGSLSSNASNVTTLQMYGDHYNITVEATGVVPNLQDNQDLVAIGQLQSASLIIASQILAQCPSKYVANTTTSG